MVTITTRPDHTTHESRHNTDTTKAAERFSKCVWGGADFGSQEWCVSAGRRACATQGDV